MRKVSYPEIDQVKNQIYNLITNHICDDGNGVSRLDVKFNEKDERYECYVGVRRGISENTLCEILNDGLLYVDYVVIPGQLTNGDYPLKLWGFDVRFDTRYYVQPIDTRCFERIAQVEADDTRGLPLYRLLAPYGMIPEDFADYICQEMPNLTIVECDYEDGIAVALVGNVIHIDDLSKFEPPKQIHCLGGVR